VEKTLVTPQTPFCGFSTAKGVSAALMFMLIEQGAFALDDPVCEYIPEFAANGKAAITIGDVLSHAAGVPFITPPYKGVELVVDEELAVQRATGKRMRTHLSEQVLDPLGFRWTNFGVPPEDVDKVVPSVKTGPRPSRMAVFLARKALGGRMDGPVSDAAMRAFLTAELPSGNLVTTASELSRFYEILTRGGELDGIRVMEPDTLRQAVQPANRMPGLAGPVSRAGFELGGRRSKFGRNTRSHFGRSGFTTQYGWADPGRGLSGAILTSGKATTDAKRPWQLCAQISATVGLDSADRVFSL
jgi:CubicO group peptidase (beta-lactamase class C family)